MFYFPTFRHRVELLVSDKMDDAVFVAFHMQMAKLTNIQVAEAAQILGEVSCTCGQRTPQFIAGVVRQTSTFQLKLTYFNFTPKHQTFTISRIITEL